MIYKTKIEEPMAGRKSASWLLLPCHTHWPLHYTMEDGRDSKGMPTPRIPFVR